jgi:hypothetical protein
MLYQNADSENMFLVAVAIIAGIVFAIMLIAAFTLLRFEDKIKKEGRSKNELTLNSLRSILSGLPAKDSPANELTANQEAVSAITDISLTALLMSGLILLIAFAFPKTDGHLNFQSGGSPIYLTILVLICTGLGGAIGIRMSHVSWQDTIVAGVLSGVGLVATSRFEFSPLFPGPWNITLGNIPVLAPALFFIIVIASGVFLLPLMDPAVRKQGPSLSVWKLMLGTILVFIMLVITRIGGNSWEGELFKFAVLPAALAMIGLILSLTNLKDAGAWLGGLAVLIALFSLVLLLIGPLLIGMYSFSVHSLAFLDGLYPDGHLRQAKV